MIAPGAFIMIYFAEGGIGRCLECLGYFEMGRRRIG